ncbi:hypothetical protein [Phaffia rhodozyma]|uniref:Uncharacterized protein n=1 Tax=Phaffia rhodozyma TaxID=264483 RepID=A0A0F7SKW4_PHARH|nr:hypothetical protein [Phaffia rhodozyma]
MPDFPPTLPVLNSTSRPESPMGFVNGSHTHQPTSLQYTAPTQTSPRDHSSSSLVESDMLTVKTPANTASGKPSSEIRPSSVYPPEVRSVVKHSSVNFVDHPVRPTPSPGIQSARIDSKQRYESDLQILRRIKLDISSGHHTSYSAIIKPLALKSVSVTAEEAESQHSAATGLPPASSIHALPSTHRPKDSSLSTTTETAVETVLLPDTDEPIEILTDSSTSSTPASIPSITAPRSVLASRIIGNGPPVPTGPSALKDRLLSANHENASRGPSTNIAKFDPSVLPPTQPRAHAEGAAGRRQKRPKVDLDSSRDGPNAMMLDYSGMYDEVPAAPATAGTVDVSKVAVPDTTSEVMIKSSKKVAPAAHQTSFHPTATTTTTTAAIKAAPLSSNDASSLHVRSQPAHTKPHELRSNISPAQPIISDSPTGGLPHGGADEEQGDQMDEEEAEIETFLTSCIEDSSATVDSDTERVDLSKSTPINTTSRSASSSSTSSSTSSINKSNSPSINPTEIEKDGRIQMSIFEPRKLVSSIVQLSTNSVPTPIPVVSSAISSWWNWRVPLMRSRAQEPKTDSESVVSPIITEVPPASSSSSSSSLHSVTGEKDALKKVTKEASREQEEKEERERLALRTKRKKRELEQQQYERVPDRPGLTNRRGPKQALKEKERRDREREAKDYKEARLNPMDKGKERSLGKGGDRYHPYERSTNGLTSPNKSTSLHSRLASRGSELPARSFDLSSDRRPEDKFPYRYDASDVNADIISAKPNVHGAKTNARSVSLGLNDNYRPGKAQGIEIIRDDLSIRQYPKPFSPSPVHAHAHVPPPAYQSGPVQSSAYPFRYQPPGPHLPPLPPPPIMDPPSTGYTRNKMSNGHNESSDWSNTVRHAPAGYRDPFPHRQQLLPQQQQQHPPPPAHPIYPHADPSTLSRHPSSSFEPLPNGNRTINNTSASRPGPNDSNLEILREMQALKEKLAMLEQQASGSGGRGGDASSAPLHTLPIPPPHPQPCPYVHHEQQHQHIQQEQHRYQQGYPPYGAPPFAPSQSSRVRNLPPRTFEGGQEKGWTATRLEGGLGGRFSDQSVPPAYQLQQPPPPPPPQQRDQTWAREDEESRRRGWR